MSYVDNAGIQIYYEVVGDTAKPQLLLVHGTGNCVADWYSLGYVDALVEHFQLIMVDGRCFGKSDKPHAASSYTIETVSSDFIAVLDTLGIGQCHYFGNSRGGNMAFIFGTLYPERFRSFAIFSAQPFGSNSAMLSDGFTRWLEDGIENLVNQLEQAVGQKFPAQLREHYLRNDAKAMIAANMMHWSNYASCFNKSNTPCLLAVGEFDSQLLVANRKCLPLIKNGEFKMLAGKSHVDVYWQGNAISPIIIDFCLRNKV